MKILHLADTHLGFRQFSGQLDPVRKLNQRECDVYAVWHAAVDIAIKREVDAVVHAGDLFDSARPSPRALSEALDAFARLRDADIPVIVIAGNHETPRFRSGGSVFEVLERFGVHAVWREPQSVRIGTAAFHAVPHESDPDQLRTDVESLRLDAAAEHNVLVVHCGIQALPRPTYAEVNQIELDPDVLAEAGFDYVALGHLHRFQAPQVNALYPGSLERLDFADLEGEKAAVEIDLAAGAGAPGFVTRHPLRTRPLIDVQIDCGGCDPTSVLERVEAELTAHELDGAVVRLRLGSLQRDVYHALDFDRLDELCAPCLHHMLVVGRDGLRSRDAAGADREELVFTDWARQRVPGGLDAERVVALAQRFLADATAEEAEAAQ
jgi:DNA repair exonuclease SbcCD nuclease subunit